MEYKGSARMNFVERKKILVLTSRFPYPVIGGDRLRIYKLCKALSKYHDLTLLSLCDNPTEVDMPVNDNVFKNIHRIYMAKYRSYINVACAFFSKKPLQVAYYESSEFKAKLAELVPEHDAIFCHLIRTADYAEKYDVAKFIDMTDAISLNYKRVSQVASKLNFKALIYSIEQKRLELYEKQMVDKFDIVSFISQVDKDYLYSPQDKFDKIKVIGNGVDTNVLKFVHRSMPVSETINLVFIGNMLSLQNMDAILFFSKKILPELKNKFNIRLVVIGRIADKDKNILNNIDSVTAVGQVDDINKAASLGHIGICPVRLGAGVQNKVLEYMSLGLPCITSSVGFEGIGAVDGKHILIANSVSEYTNVIKCLSMDNEFYSTIALNARAFVESEFSWDAKLTPFSDAVNRELYSGL